MQKDPTSEIFASKCSVCPSQSLLLDSLLRVLCGVNVGENILIGVMVRNLILTF